MKSPFWLGLGATVVASSYFAVRFPDHELGPAFAIVGIILIAAPAILAAVRWLGPVRGLGMLLSLSALAYAVETFGLLTGWPYGSFAYGDSIGPKIGGVVPILLPFAFVPLALGAIALAGPVRPTRTAAWFAGGVAALVAFDVVLDPGAVAMGYWSYTNDGIYYGVPIGNFIGWVFSAAIVLATARYWIAPTEKAYMPPPPSLGLSSFISMAYWAGVALWLALWIPCLVGAILLLALLPKGTATWRSG